MDVAGTGVVVIVGDQQASVNNFISTGQITNSVGTNVLVDYNNINAGKTTIYPSSLYLPPAQAVWNPALNPDTDGLWNDPTNWSGSGGLVPGNPDLCEPQRHGCHPLHCEQCRGGRCGAH